MYFTAIPKSLPRQFLDRVRKECEAAILKNTTCTYQQIVEIAIGDADRGSDDRRHIRLVVAALNKIMEDDARAGRPFFAAAVRRADTGYPGDHFIVQCWELGRFDGTLSEKEFVDAEWTRLRQYLGCPEVGSEQPSSLAVAA